MRTRYEPSQHQQSVKFKYAIPLGGVPQVADTVRDKITGEGEHSLSGDEIKHCNQVIAAACEEIRRRHLEAKLKQDPTEEDEDSDDE